MKIIPFLLIMLSLSTTVQAEFDEMRSIAAMKKILADKSVYVIDLRSKAEYEEGHIVGAIHVNYTDLKSWQPGHKGLSANTSIFLYCELGNLSAKGADLLTDAGFKRVVDAGSFGGLMFASKLRL